MQKNVLVYCRESRDDAGMNYDRIETQRDILVAFCERHQLGVICGIVMDDNRSGVCFDRMEPIRERVLLGEVDIILCKDASRLGRNVLESLSFTEFLANHGVTLVFESERYDEDFFPLVAWFNERRAKDDSVKIRRVLRHKMEEGTLVIKAPYGYRKEGNRLVVDVDAAPVVLEIFNLFVGGHTRGEIAARLNGGGVRTPSQLKSEYQSVRSADRWNAQHIDRILKHRIYTGDMPYSMREKVSYKSKRYVHKPACEWIVVRDHHEAIVPRDTFEQAQSLLCRKKIHTHRDN